MSARVTVPAGGRRSLEMALVWHMPEVRFGAAGGPATRSVTGAEMAGAAPTAGACRVRVGRCFGKWRVEWR